MGLIANKEVILNSFKRCAEKKLLDKDYLLTKLQSLVLDVENNITQEEVQPIVDILVPVEETPTE